MAKNVTRRTFLKAGAAGAAGVAGAVAGGLTPRQGRLIDAALASAPGGGTLGDIEHVVILMQENRSFDHYFGTMSGVLGFGDRGKGHPYQSYAHGPVTDLGTVFHQTTVGSSITGAPATAFTVGGASQLWPFELVSTPPTVDGQTTNDITHDWGPQHGAWNNGAMDRWVVEHLANDPLAKWEITPGGLVPVPSTSSWPTGITTMGYYRQKDSLAFYRALAEAFTLCQRYHCSVLGPTHPNRLFAMSGTLGAHSGDVGGPVLTTYVEGYEQIVGTLQWPTMPEVLTAHDVSWKVYGAPTATALFNVLDFFEQYVNPTAPGYDPGLAANGLVPLYPAQFAADVVAGTLPQVSWIMPPAESCEHPAAPPEYGEYLVSQILQTLLLNPAVWERTVFLVVYDENGGFFDHVPPPTPGPTVQVDQSGAVVTGAVPSGPAYDGEYVDPAHTTNAAGPPPADWAGVIGPVGLGFRVPALVISPFSRGGGVNSDVFDHVSTLKLIEALFLAPKGASILGGAGGGPGLHISPWRYGLVGDMTSALPNAVPRTDVPPLPPTSLLFPDVAAQAVVNALAGTVDDGQGYPPPTQNSGGYTTPDLGT